MDCIYINKKSTEWKNFQASVGSEAEAVQRYVIAGNKIPNVEPKTKRESLRYEGLVNSKRQSLEFIQSNIVSLENRKKGASRDVITELQRDINVYKKLESDTIAAIDNLSSADLKAQALPNVKAFAEGDIALVKTILSSDTISPEKLLYTEQVIKMWQFAGDFSGEHPYMSKEELALVGKTDEPNIYDEYVGYFTKWRQEADLLQNRWLELAREIQDKHMKGTLKFAKQANYEETPKINSLFQTTIGISEIDSSLVQSLQATLTRAEFETKKEADVVFKEIGRLMGNLRKRGKEREFIELIKQRDNKGRATRNLVDWTSSEFVKIKTKISKDYNNKIEAINNSSDSNKEQLRRDEEANYYRSLAEIENGIDPNMLFSEDEGVKDEYIANLREVLGTDVADYLIEDSNKKLQQYELDKEDYESSISESSDIVISESMKAWENRYSPYKVYAKRFAKGAGFSSLHSLSSKYITTFPKKNLKKADGSIKESGFYDSNFSNILNDKDFAETYLYIIDTLRKLNALVPNNKLDFLGSNTLPSIEKLLLESIFSDGAGTTLLTVFDRMKVANRTSKTSTVLSDTKRLPDGTIQKELQYNFVGNNRKEVGDYISLKTIQYNQQYHEAPPVELVDEWVADKNAELSGNMSWDLERVIKAYALSAIGYKNKAKIEGIMKLTEGHIQRASTIKTNKAGEKLSTRGGLPFLDKNDANVIELVNDYMDYFFGYDTKKDEGVLNKTYTKDEFKTKEEVEVAIQKNIDLFNEQRDIINVSIEEASEKDKETLQNKLSQLESGFTTVNEKLYNQLNALGGNVVMSKVVDSFLKYNRLLRLGYNLVASVNNAVVGHIGLAIEASDGRRFNSEQLKRSIAISHGAMLHSATFGLVNTTEAKKIRNAMHKYDVLKDSKNEIYTFKQSTLSNKLDALTPSNLSTRTEYLNQANTFIPMLLNTVVTLEDGTVANAWDAMDEDGNLPEGAVLSDSKGVIDESILKIKIDEAIRTIHGNYDPDSKLMYKNSVIGRVLGQFRNWAFMGFHERFGAEKYNELARLDKKGRYISYGELYKAKKFRTLVTVTEQLLRHIASAPVLNKITGISGTTFEQIEGLSDVDVANLKKNMTELATMLLIAAGILLTKALFMDDDDEDSVIEKMAIMAMINTLDRTSTDLLFYSSPAAFQELNKSIIPAASLLKDVGSLGIHVGKLLLGGDDEYATGDYAGQSQSAIKASKISVGAAQILRTRNFLNKELSQ